MRDVVEKRNTVRIIERNAGGHFDNVGGRMQRVAFDEWPAEGMCQCLAERGLAAARDTHDDDDVSHAPRRIAMALRLSCSNW
jgi:hypothetical protein